MTGPRHFSVAEANAALDWIRPRLEELRAARDRLGEREAHEALTEAASGNGGGEHGRTIGEGFLEVRRLLGRFSDAGLILRDLDRGLVDFPALRDGEEIYLCWQEGEDEVGFWHAVDAGFEGREPIE